MPRRTNLSNHSGKRSSKRSSSRKTKLSKRSNRKLSGGNRKRATKKGAGLGRDIGRYMGRKITEPFKSCNEITTKNTNKCKIVSADKTCNPLIDDNCINPIFLDRHRGNNYCGRGYKDRKIKRCEKNSICLNSNRDPIFIKGNPLDQTGTCFNISKWVGIKYGNKGSGPTNFEQTIKDQLELDNIIKNDQYHVNRNNYTEKSKLIEGRRATTSAPRRPPPPRRITPYVESISE